MIRISIAERRNRLAIRHQLVRRASSVEAASESLVGFHASDPVSVYLAARARVEGFEVASLEAALYERRSLVRMLGMRRTMFVVTPGVAAVMDAACTRALAIGQRRRLTAIIEDQGVADDGVAWLADVENRTLDALHELGSATASELTAVVPELGEKVHFGHGKTWGGSFGMSTRVLFLLATDGRIVRGRPLGTWLSSQYRWVPTDSWIDGGLADLPEEQASQDLVGRWLYAFGPGTLTDLKWWTGWTIGKTRAVLGAVDAVEVDLNGETGYVLPNDIDRVDDPGPWVALLPGLDPTAMGWKERDWYFGEHKEQLFDRNGNAGATVWANGRVIGGWAQHPDGEVVVELLEPVEVGLRDAIHAEAAALTAWLGETRITPRFRTPLEKRLSST